MLGLIGAALKGASEGYATYAKGELENQQKLDYAKQILEMQEEKDRRVAEFTADLGVRTKKREIAEVDPLKIASDVNRTKQVGGAETEVLTDRTGKVGAAETDVLTNRETALRPGKIQTAEDTALAQGRAERTNMGAYANDPNARKGARAKAQDQHVESSGSVAQANLANYQLTQLRAVSDLKMQLSKLGKDDPKRDEIKQQIDDLTLGTSAKSLSDVVTSAEAYRKMADNLRRDADKITDNEAERKTMLQRATEYETQADVILRGAVGKRLPGSAAGTKPVESTRSVPAVGKPWEKYQTK